MKLVICDCRHLSKYETSAIQSSTWIPSCSCHMEFSFSIAVDINRRPVRWWSYSKFAIKCVNLRSFHEQKTLVSMSSLVFIRLTALSFNRIVMIFVHGNWLYPCFIGYWKNIFFQCRILCKGWMNLYLNRKQVFVFSQKKFSTMGLSDLVSIEYLG